VHSSAAGSVRRRRDRPRVLTSSTSASLTPITRSISTRRFSNSELDTGGTVLLGGGVGGPLVVSGAVDVPSLDNNDDESLSFFPSPPTLLPCPSSVTSSSLSAPRSPLRICNCCNITPGVTPFLFDPPATTSGPSCASLISFSARTSSSRSCTSDLSRRNRSSVVSFSCTSSTPLLGYRFDSTEYVEVDGSLLEGSRRAGSSNELKPSTSSLDAGSKTTYLVLPRCPLQTACEPPLYLTAPRLCSHSLLRWLPSAIVVVAQSRNHLLPVTSRAQSWLRGDSGDGIHLVQAVSRQVWGLVQVGSRVLETRRVSWDPTRRVLVPRLGGAGRTISGRVEYLDMAARGERRRR
jgi:hypothetical protein